jgi:hypothetical protein
MNEYGALVEWCWQETKRRTGTETSPCPATYELCIAEGMCKCRQRHVMTAGLHEHFPGDLYWPKHVDNLLKGINELQIYYNGICLRVIA